MALTCRQCGFALPDGARFCIKCDTLTSPPSEEPLPEVSQEFSGGGYIERPDPIINAPENGVQQLEQAGESLPLISKQPQFVKAYFKQAAYILTHPFAFARTLDAQNHEIAAASFNFLSCGVVLTYLIAGPALFMHYTYDPKSMFFVIVIVGRLAIYWFLLHWVLKLLRSTRTVRATFVGFSYMIGLFLPIMIGLFMPIALRSGFNLSFDLGGAGEYGALFLNISLGLTLASGVLGLLFGIILLFYIHQLSWVRLIAAVTVIFGMDVFIL